MLTAFSCQSGLKQRKWLWWFSKSREKTAPSTRDIYIFIPLPLSKWSGNLILIIGVGTEWAKGMGHAWSVFRLGGGRSQWSGPPSYADAYRIRVCRHLPFASDGLCSLANYSLHSHFQLNYINYKIKPYPPLSAVRLSTELTGFKPLTMNIYWEDADGGTAAGGSIHFVTCDRISKDYFLLGDRERVAPRQWSAAGLACPEDVQGPLRVFMFGVISRSSLAFHSLLWYFS